MATETVVGVDNITGEGTAHLVVIRNPDTWLGMAFCGYPSERLALMPGLDWPLVPTERRCPHCAEADQPIPKPSQPAEPIPMPEPRSN